MTLAPSSQPEALTTSLLPRVWVSEDFAGLPSDLRPNMARGESLVDVCTKSISLGNNISIHVLDFLSIVKVAPNGFQDLAVEFLETSRVLIATKTGLSDTVDLSANADKDLRERLKQTQNGFTVLDQVVNRYNENERKHGLGKLGKGIRMMFADTGLEKLKTSLKECRENLTRSCRSLQWSLDQGKIEAAAGIGYTALAAVLDRPDPTRSKELPEPPTSQIPLDLQSLSAPTTTAPTITDRHLGHLGHVDSMDLRRPAPSASFAELSTPRREPSVSRTFGRENKLSSSSHAQSTLSNRSSSLGIPSEDLSRSTAPTSFELDNGTPSHDTVPRITRKPRPGANSAASKAALLAAVQQKNHQMVEQLLDWGVPADNGIERNLLTVAIVNHDLNIAQLLLLYGADVNAQDKDGITPLFTATQASFFEAAHLLLRYSADPNQCTGHGETPFVQSLVSGQTKFAQLFLQHGADSDRIMDNGNTPFIQAITKTVSIGLIELMLENNASPDCKNKRGETALFKAINVERLDIVTTLVEHGSNPNLPGPKHMLWPSVHQPKVLEFLLNHGADVNRAPGVLELASSINSMEAVTVLLAHGADPNAKKDGIFTPLCTSIRDDHEDILDILLSAGASPNLKASEWPAFKCVTHHRPHLLPKVLAAGADPNNPKGIIEAAVAHNERACLMILLGAGADVNARSTTGHTALTTAIRKNDLELLDILLAHGADPGVRGQEWPISMAVKNPTILTKLLPHIAPSKIIRGALEQAVVANQLESVKLLLEAGVNVEEKNGGVFSPLTTSIREDRKDIFRYLIDEAKADPNSPGEHLPIIKAIRRHRENDLSYIEHLLTKGADINLMYRGWNAVLQAVDNGDTQILQLLADRGHPDLHAQDENGRTVMEIMEERGLQEEERILLKGRSPSPEIRNSLTQLRGLVQE